MRIAFWRGRAIDIATTEAMYDREKLNSQSHFVGAILALTGAGHRQPEFRAITDPALLGAASLRLLREAGYRAVS